MLVVIIKNLNLMQVNLNELSAAKSQSASVSSNPDVQEYIHTLTETNAEGNLVASSKTFLELTIRNEGFKATEHSSDDIIHFKEILDVPSTRQGSTANSKVLAISVETQTLTTPNLTPNGKNVFRVVLVNE